MARLSKKQKILAFCGAWVAICVVGQFVSRPDAAKPNASTSTSGISTPRYEYQTTTLEEWQTSTASQQADIVHRYVELNKLPNNSGDGLTSCANEYAQSASSGLQMGLVLGWCKDSYRQNPGSSPHADPAHLPKTTTIDWAGAPTVFLDASRFTGGVPSALAEAMTHVNLAMHPAIFEKSLVIVYNFDSVDKLLASGAMESVCDAYLQMTTSQKKDMRHKIQNIYILDENLAISKDRGFMYKGVDSICREYGNLPGNTPKESSPLVKYQSAANFITVGFK